MKIFHSICATFLLICFVSVLFAADDFNRFEEGLLINPPGYGVISNEVSIYSQKSHKITKEAMDQQFGSLKSDVTTDKKNRHEVREFSPYLKFNQEGIKVYLFSHKNSKVGTFKATTHIKASFANILAVLFDNASCPNWIHSCGQAFILDNVSFNERYHYQVFDMPFPFIDRDFIFHSIMKQDPKNKSISITMSSAPDYCRDKRSTLCDKVNQSNLVRVRKSIGTYKLEADDKGTVITWIQHTDPAGYIPSWLVNQFSSDTPFWTFKNLEKMVKRDKYKQAKLICDPEGMALALELSDTKTSAPKLTQITDER